MKKALLVFCALACITTGGTASAALSNYGFETGTTAGWNLALNGGSAEVVTSATTADGTLFTATEGKDFLVLTGGTGDIYVTASQQFAAGGSISGYAAFDGRDYFNDNAFVRVLDSNNSLVATPWSSSISAVGNNGHTPWTLWSWTAPSQGSYTLQYGVENAWDPLFSSRAFFDAAVTPTPIPPTAFLFGSGVMSLGIFRKLFRRLTV